MWAQPGYHHQEERGSDNYCIRDGRREKRQGLATRAFRHKAVAEPGGSNRTTKDYSIKIPFLYKSMTNPAILVESLTLHNKLETVIVCDPTWKLYIVIEIISY
jgi:hypothetical protein